MIRTPPPATTPSFEKSAKPLLLALEPSRCWQTFLLVLHGLCLAAVYIAAMPLWIKPVLCLLTMASLAYHLKQHTMPPQLIWRNANRWFVDDESAPVALSSINFFSRWLIILSLSGDNPADADRNASPVNAIISRLKRTRKFIIPFDSLSAESFRLLRVRLRIEGYELLNPTDDIIK